MRSTRVEHHVYFHLPESLLTIGDKIMSKLDDLTATLAAASTKLDELAASEAAQSQDINEVASDMSAVLQLLAAGDPNSPQVTAALETATGLLGRLTDAAAASAAQATALRAVADQFTPPA